jgi:glycine cleavage system aminomethyltransferase T
MPFTADDFDPQLAEALGLMPDLLGDERAGIRYAINGLISMTPDGHPLLGEMPRSRGVVGRGELDQEGPGCGRVVAELMSGRVPTIDVHEADVARFYPSQQTVAHVRARAREGFNKMYGIVHPAEQWESGRPLRVSPFYQRAADLGAVFFETAGWERPHWYACNEPLLSRYAGKLGERSAEWDARWWSPVINAEHLAMREACGVVDLSAFAVFDITGPAALDAVQSLVVAQADVRHGRVIYTSLLDADGGFKADLTVMRLGAEHFRVVTGGATGMAEKKWFTDHLPPGAQLADLTSAWTTLGVWGPRARDVLQPVTLGDLSHAAFGFGTCREVEMGGVTVLASRISYVGELGWELYVPMEQGAAVWDIVWGAGRAHGLVPVGIGVYGTTGRLQKGYRAFGNELTPDYNLVEAGMTRPRVKEQPFLGKEAHLAQREAPPAAVLCTLTVDANVSADGQPRYMLGGEPILSADGERLVDAAGRPSYVTSAGAGPSVGKHLLMAYLPPERAREGARLAVEYFGEQYPVTVAVAGSTRCSTRRTPGCGAERDGDRRLRQARPHGRRQDRADRGRAGGGYPDVRVHHQPARGMRRGGGGPDHRAARRDRLGDHARPGGGRRPAPRGAGARRQAGGPAGDRRPGMGADRHRGGHRGRGPPARRQRAGLRPAAVRQRGGRHRRLSGGHPGGLRPGLAVRHRDQEPGDHRGRRRGPGPAGVPRRLGGLRVRAARCDLRQGGD